MKRVEELSGKHITFYDYEKFAALDDEAVQQTIIDLFYEEQK